MKTRISVQERLKDLRVERGLNLEELAQETGISKSALGSYENDNDEYKEINHGIQIQFVIHGNFPDFFNVKRSQSGSTGNKDRLCCFSRDKLSRTF